MLSDAAEQAFGFGAGTGNRAGDVGAVTVMIDFAFLFADTFTAVHPVCHIQVFVVRHAAVDDGYRDTLEHIRHAGGRHMPAVVLLQHADRQAGALGFGEHAVVAADRPDRSAFSDRVRILLADRYGQHGDTGERSQNDCAQGFQTCAFLRVRHCVIGDHQFHPTLACRRGSRDCPCAATARTQIDSAVSRRRAGSVQLISSITNFN